MPIFFFFFGVLRIDGARSLRLERRYEIFGIFTAGVMYRNVGAAWCWILLQLFNLVEEEGI